MNNQPPLPPQTDVLGGSPILPSHQEVSSKTRKRFTLATYLILLVVLGSFTYDLFAPYLLTLITGALIAVLTRPLFTRIVKRGFSTKVAAGLVVLIFAVGIIIPILGLFVAAGREVGHLASTVTQQNQMAPMEEFARKISKWKSVQLMFGSPEEFYEKLSATARSITQALATQTLNFLSSLPELILQTTLALMACFFFLIDAKRLIRWTYDKVPLTRGFRHHVFQSFRATAVSTIWATIAAAAAQSGILLFAFIVLGIPLALLAAAISFVFAWIPILGTTPVWGLAIIYLITKAAYVKAIIMLAFGVVIGISDNVVRAMLLRGQTDMHPLLSLVAIFGGIEMFGILGVFFGPVILAVMLALLDVWPTMRKRFGIFNNHSQI